ncbi:MAG: MFS transporter [Pseudomonadota bacterium]
MLSFLRREARWLIAGALLTAFSGFGQTYFVSLSNAALRDTFGLSHGRIGLIYALATLTSAFILLEFGKIVDRYATRTTALIVSVGLACACALLAAAPVWWVLFPAFLGLRLFGQGMMSHVAMTATGRWFEAQRGRAVSLVALGYPISEILLPPITVLAIAWVGWRGTWAIAAGFLLMVCVPLLYLLLSRERIPAGHTDASSPREHQDVAQPAWRRSDVLREPSFWAMLCGILAPAFMVTGLFFHHQHLLELKSWPQSAFALGFSVFAIVSVVTSLIVGALVDRFSTRAMLPYYLLPMALALVLPACLSGVWVVFAMMVLLGVMAGSAATIMGAIWPELYGTQYLGEIRALSFSAMVASSAASPLLIGVLIDRGIDFPLQLAVMGGYALLASGLMGLIQPRLSAVALGRVSPSLAD